MILIGKISSLKKGQKMDSLQRGWSMTLAINHNFYFRCFFTEIYVTKDRFSILMNEKNDFKWKHLKF